MAIERWRYLSLVAALLLLPFNLEHELATYGAYPDLQHRVSLFAFDVPLALCAVLTAVAVARLGPGPIRTFVRGLAALLLLTAFAWCFNPSPRGLQVLVRLIFTLGVPAVAIALAPETWRRRLCASFLLAGVIQSEIALLQVLKGETLGLTRLGEHPPLLSVGGEVSAKGTFVHPYVLAGFAVIACGVALAAYLASGQRPWLFALAAVAVPVGLTYSRMSVLAVAAVATTLFVGRFLTGDRAFVALAVLLLGVGVPSLLSLDGWISRAQQSVDTTGAGLDAITSSRGALVQNASDVIGSDPIVGVGPGRYALELEARDVVPPGGEVVPVHNVPMLIAAEGGVVTGLVALGGLIWLGWRALRGGPGAAALYVGYVPFLMLDHFPYDSPQGLAMTGAWIGAVLAIDATTSPARRASDSSTMAP